MLEKMPKVSNPLTIIAIFACLAEIAGTVILPLVPAATQFYFVWFVMLFPALLVVLFFATLNWNHKVLYGPGDFQDDGSFLALVQASVTIGRAQTALADATESTDDEEKRVLLSSAKDAIDEVVEVVASNSMASVYGRKEPADDAFLQNMRRKYLGNVAIRNGATYKDVRAFAESLAQTIFSRPVETLYDAEWTTIYMKAEAEFERRAKA